MTSSPFRIGSEYTRADIYRLVGVPGSQQRGNWETGYNFFGGACYVFANVGVAGRTGHNYGNRFVGDELEHMEWFAKRGTRLSQPEIRRLLNPQTTVLLFFRIDSRSAFTFAGIAKPIQQFDEQPVRVIWSFADSEETDDLTEEAGPSASFKEGTLTSVRVNRYERSRNARLLCIQIHGRRCAVCGFDFETQYGDRGRGFIVVHHLVPLSAIRQEYQVDPVNDLRPVCANCHEMIHRTEPPLSPEELRSLLRRDART